MRKNALVTLQIGRSEFFEPVSTNFRKVCEKHNWSFEIINKRAYRFLPIRKKIRRIQFEKFQVGELLKKYDRILYLDSDILASEDLPDIFKLVPENSIGCVMEDVGPLKWKRDEERLLVQRKLGQIPNWQGGYFNSGMLVLSRMHRPIFSTKWKDLAGGRWADQTTLNYQVRTHGFSICSLPKEFNYHPEMCTEWLKDDHRRNAHVVHYAGPAAKIIMREDLRNRS